VNDNDTAAATGVHPVHQMNIARAPGDQAELQTRLNWQLQYYIHHRHLLLLSPKADIHFSIQWREEG